MKNPLLLQSLNEQASILLEQYLTALVKSHTTGFQSHKECAVLELGNWILEQLGYPTSIDMPDDEPREPRTKRFKRDYRQMVFERDNYTCQQCGATTDLTVDHIIPVSRGGDSSGNNLTTLCRSCNSSKGTKVQ